MQQFEKFIVQGRKIKNNETLSFHYSFDDREEFIEEITFPGIDLTHYTKNQLKPYCDAISIALGISYYKLFPTKEIIVEEQILIEDQQLFWNNFYIQGLGEFFYVNELDPSGLATTIVGIGKDAGIIDSETLEEKTLLLRGGGKDSIVSYELLKYSYDMSLFTFGKEYPIHKATSDITGEDRILVHRKLDRAQLKKMHAEGYYNGHVPITGIISFVSTLVCKLYGFNRIITSNEQSANFGNTEWKGMTINHQWSKSFEFEEMFLAYIKEYINDGLVYYSKLRDLFERQIAEKFAKYKQYFDVFSSCNRNFHLDGSTPENRRCCICPKCLFVYIILRPFITEEETIHIRGKELYSEEGLLPLAQELRGINGIKPLECVGTIDESKEMTALFLENNKELATTMPVTQRFIDNVIT